MLIHFTVSPFTSHLLEVSQGVQTLQSSHQCVASLE